MAALCRDAATPLRAAAGSVWPLIDGVPKVQRSAPSPTKVRQRKTQYAFQQYHFQTGAGARPFLQA